MSAFGTKQTLHGWHWSAILREWDSMPAWLVKDTLTEPAGGFSEWD
jgi:hypothetical protein